VSRITVIDYGMGNLASVQKALVRLGYEPHLTNQVTDIETASRLILPGVGAFGAAMSNLGELGLIDPLRDYCSSGRPFLGICLGMQLVMTHSSEQGSHTGLDIIPGRVAKFYETSPAPSDIKIPHMGWNGLNIKQRSGMLSDVAENASVYFVHSYYVVPEDSKNVAAESTHGETFCSVAANGNIWATQFHPEKSGAVGLSMLRSFCELPS